MPPPLSSADPTGLLGHTLDGRYQVVAFVGDGDLGYPKRRPDIASFLTVLRTIPVNEDSATRFFPNLNVKPPATQPVGRTLRRRTSHYPIAEGAQLNNPRVQIDERTAARGPHPHRGPAFAPD